MVTVNKEMLDRPPISSTTLREDLIPRVGKSLKFCNAAKVGNIARNSNSINTLLVKPFKRTARHLTTGFQEFRRAYAFFKAAANMNVTYDT
jgi:hypothetical protein